MSLEQLGGKLSVRGQSKNSPFTSCFPSFAVPVCVSGWIGKSRFNLFLKQLRTKYSVGLRGLPDSLQHLWVDVCPKQFPVSGLPLSRDQTRASDNPHVIQS